MKVVLKCLTIRESARHLWELHDLAEKNLPVEFVFGRVFSDEFIAEHVNPSDRVWKISMYSRRKGYLNRAYSCAYGHREILMGFLEDEDAELCVVMEDDAIVPENILEIAQEVAEAFPETDVWHLSTQGVRRYNWRYRNGGAELPPVEQDIYVKNDRVSGSVCYMVNRAGAKALLEQIGEIHGPSDVIQFFGKVKVANVYGTGVELHLENQIDSLIGRPFDEACGVVLNNPCSR